MADFATLYLQLKNRQFNSGVDTSQKKLKAFGATSLKFGAILTGLSVPLIAFGKASLKAASDAGEVSDKFGTVFLEVRKDAERTAKSIAKSYGLAISTSKELLSSTGDILSGFGFTDEKSFELSQRVLKLGADLASFSNIEGGAKRAVQALTKALVGETESAKALGVVIRQNSKEFKDLVKEGIKMRGETLLQAKAMAALTIAVSQSPKAIGDTQRTWGSYANTMKRVNEQSKVIRENFGKVILGTINIGNVLESTVIKIKSFSKWMLDSSKTTKLLIVGILALIPIIAGLSLAIGGIILLIPTLIAGLSALTVAVTSLAVAALPVLVAIAGYKLGELIAEMTGLSSAIENLTFKWMGLNEIIKKGNESEAKSLAISAQRKKIADEEARLKNSQLSSLPVSKDVLSAQARLQETIFNIEFRRANNAKKLVLLQEKLNKLTTERVNLNDKVKKLDITSQIKLVEEQWNNIKKSMTKVVTLTKKMPTAAKGVVGQKSAQDFTQVAFAGTVEAQKRELGQISSSKATENNTKKTADSTNKIAKSNEKIAQNITKPPVFVMA